MSEVTITNGVIKYSETRKITEFEPKRAEVELAFNIAEGQDPDECIEIVTVMVHNHVQKILGSKSEVAAPKPAKETKSPGKPPKMPAADKPAAKPAADASAVVDEPTPAAKTEAPKADAAAVGDDDLGDLMGGAEPAKEITDKELNDATQKCQAAVKNAPAIRKLLTDLGIKSPPGRIIDLPQENRQKYLDGLKEIKPLA